MLLFGCNSNENKGRDTSSAQQSPEASSGALSSSSASSSQSPSSSSDDNASSSPAEVATAILITGVATTGSPIAEANVTAVCDQGGVTTTATTDSTGAFALEVPRNTLPCALSVPSEQLGRELHTLVMAPYDTQMANITPATDIILVQATREMPEAYLDGTLWNIDDNARAFASRDFVFTSAQLGLGPLPPSRLPSLFEAEDPLASLSAAWVDHFQQDLAITDYGDFLALVRDGYLRPAPGGVRNGGSYEYNLEGMPVVSGLFFSGSVVVNLPANGNLGLMVGTSGAQGDGITRRILLNIPYFDGARQYTLTGSNDFLVAPYLEITTYGLDVAGTLGVEVCKVSADQPGTLTITEANKYGTEGIFEAELVCIQTASNLDRTEQIVTRPVTGSFANVLYAP